MGKGKDTSKMPKNFAVAQRFFELTFTKKLNEKFKKWLTKKMKNVSQDNNKVFWLAPIIALAIQPAFFYLST